VNKKVNRRSAETITSSYGLWEKIETMISVAITRFVFTGRDDILVAFVLFQMPQKNRKSKK
jgi:ABC-type maltose transport system permease subunit